MAKVVGLGGVFVKSRDPKALQAWYRDALGLDMKDWGAKIATEGRHTAAWNAFSADTDYFDPGKRDFMVNFRVDDLDGLLKKLRERGDRVLDRGESGEYGKFGYVLDPDETLIELWQPPAT